MNGTVLVAEDDRDLAEALADALGAEGFQLRVAYDGRSALAYVGAEPEIGLVLSDVNMPGLDGHALLRGIKASRPELPVVLMTAYGSITRAVQAMREGASDYLVKPFEAERLLQVVKQYVLPVAAGDGDDPVASDPLTHDLLSLTRRVAESDVTLLLTGESGTGKEVIARYLHRHSRRAGGPFVAINCAAIPENMLEAMLFGYEKGAFTGAMRAQAGKFEQAQGGTLLLDEIGEMEAGLQAKLLRVLQEREVERIGGAKTIPLDVRIVAATNRDLRAEVAAGRFREDLFFRLNVFPLQIPPLRERPADIVPLAERMLAKAARSAGRAVPRLTPESCSLLRAYPWPGNVRELDNVMQRALILQSGDSIEARDLRFESELIPRSSREQGPAGGGGSAEQRELLAALRGGNRKVVAERLGISERTLRYRIARMREAGITIP